MLPKLERKWVHDRRFDGGGLFSKKANEEEASDHPGGFLQISAAIMDVIKAVLFFGLVSLMALMLLGPPSTGSKPARVEQDFLAIHNALGAYAANAGQPPATAQGLEALVNEPLTSPKPNRWAQVLKILPADPWETPYRYALVAPREREWRWELRSAGPDRLFGNRDDLARDEEWGDYLTFEDESVESRPSY